MPTTFLMCPPRYFDVNYVINPWMQGHWHNICQPLAEQQWTDFYNRLKSLADVHCLEPAPHLPDLVFTANAGLVQGRLCVLSHFRHPERQREEPIFKHWFTTHGFDVLELPNTIYFEGAGDALFQPGENILWMGYGIRSDKKASDYLKTHFHTEVIPLRLIHDSFYHLDTCFCPLSSGWIMYYPEAFDALSQAAIAAHVPQEKRLIVTREDALQFVCNAVLVPPRYLFMTAASPALQRSLQEQGYEVIVQPVDEFKKAGGANKCLTLELE